MDDRATPTETARRIASFICGGNGSECDFEALALELFHYQCETNPLYRNYLQSRGIAPADIREWRMIPPLPQSAFKLGRVATFPEDESVKSFLTSGTTGDLRGAHHFKTLDYYELAIHAGWDRLIVPDIALHCLVPSPEHAPRSSLAHMTRVLAGRAAGAVCHADADGHVNVPRLIDALTGIRHPVGILGTAIAFLHICREMQSDGRSLHLPEGSFIMETGGYKGRRDSLTKVELYEMLSASFGIPDDAMINEYGMTELSSQFYARGADGIHGNQPWSKIMVINPENGREVAVGEAGLVKAIDLANVDSCLAVQTRDFAIREESGFRLLGRDPGALPRGCSRAWSSGL